MKGWRHRRRCLLCASIALHSIRRVDASFIQVPSLLPALRPSMSRCKNGVAADDADENAILGETLDVTRHGGTYSWSNTRSPDRSKSSASRDGYKRIHFDGCGSILLHQQPEDFAEPKESKTDSNKQASGSRLWSASYVISYYIDKQLFKGGTWYLDERGHNKWTVLELGAGLGLCSAVAAKHGLNVVATDNDPAVLTLLEENLGRNKDTSLEPQSSAAHDNPSKQQVVHVHSLDWITVANDPHAESSHAVFVQLENLGGADLILLSDVVYGATEPAWEALLLLLNNFGAQRKRLCLEQVNTNATTYTKRSRPIVLLGYTQRRRDMSPEDEARFFAMLQAAGMEAILIPSANVPNGEKYMLTSLFELRWVD